MQKFKAKNAKKCDFRKAKIIERNKNTIFGFYFFSLMQSKNFKAKKMLKIIFLFHLEKAKKCKTDPFSLFSF